MTVLVYGASDDLIEIEGDITEEFSAYDFDGHLAFSNGVVLSARYDDDGMWRFAPVRGADKVKIEYASGEEGKDDDGYPAYSDKVMVTGETLWVALVKEIAYSR